MGVVEEATWSAPLVSEAMPPNMADRDEFSQRLNREAGYSDFILKGRWNEIDEVPRPIYNESGEVPGETYACPEGK